jgi:predicted PurR-regulated permease PerM
LCLAFHKKKQLALKIAELKDCLNTIILPEMTQKNEKGLPDYRLILLAVGFLWLFYHLLPILSPFFVAMILSYICNPLVDRMARIQIATHTIGRVLASLAIMLLLMLILLILLLIVIPLLQKEFSTVIERLPVYLNNFRTQIEPWLMQHFGISPLLDTAQLQEVLTKNWKSASNYLGQFLLALSNHGLALIGWLVNLLLLPVVLFYLLRDWHTLIANIAVTIPRPWLKKTTEIAQDIDQVLSGFLRGQLSVMLAMSVFYSVGLMFTGLELAIPIGLLAGLLGFVPYFGIITGISLATLAAILQYSSFDHLLPVLAVFGMGQVVEGMWLTPWLVGDRIGLHPVVVIFALLAGGQLFGFTGILVALPVSAAIAVGFRHARQHYLQSDLYLN